MNSKTGPETIVVIGTGYVGLPAALLLAQAGCRVIGVDIDENIVRAINDGVLHIREEQLEAVMRDPVVRANLVAQGTPSEADAFLIAVPTPLDPQKKVADLQFVVNATESILPYLRPGNLVVLESTVPPLTCRRLLAPMIERVGFKVGTDIFMAHCPERILPGNVFYEIVHNDRIIGGVNAASALRAHDLYARFVKGQLFLTDDVTAELAKLMENAYRDVNIALANEFAAVAGGLGVDPLGVIDLANRHPRVNILQPGIGVGGHCICLDPWFIKEVDPANSRLIFTARQINGEQPHKIAARIRRAFREHRDSDIVVIGATYKPDTCDVRESPANDVVEELRQDGYRIRHYDPLVDDMTYSSMIDVCRGAGGLVILVEHRSVRDELRKERDSIRAVMHNPIILRFYSRDEYAQTPEGSAVRELEAALAPAI